MFEKKDIKKNDILFNFKSIIEQNKILIIIESEGNKYSNKYDYEQLKKISRYFKMSENLEEAFNDLNTLLDKDFSIRKENKNIELNFPFEKGDIKLLLIKKDESSDISYDNLTAKMKEIIDKNQLVLGIDLGTTCSCAAIMIDEKIIMIRNSLGSTTTPSFVYFINENKVYVGELAKLLPSDEKNVIYNTKRLIGKSIDDEEIKEIIKNMPFKFKNDNITNLVKFSLVLKNQKKEKDNLKNKNKPEENKINEKEEEVFEIKEEDDEIKEEEEEKEIEEELKEINEEFYPEQICSLILKKIIKDSEFFLSKNIGKDIKINKCVLTVPAYFNQKQREATLNSAKIIGLDVKTMINEPTAASLVNTYKILGNVDKHLIVIDFGGGTLDITLLRFLKDENGIYSNILKTYGNTHFGGEDFDKALMEQSIQYLNKKLSSKNTIYQDTEKNKRHFIRLKRACERAKIRLSNSESTFIHLENYLGQKSINFKIERDNFLQYCKKLFNKFEKILEDFIKISDIKKNKIKISEVILIGGTTLIPKIKDIVMKKFPDSVIKYDLDPKEVVAKGAAIRGAKLMNLPSVEDIKLYDVTNLSLGIKQKGDKFDRLINRSSRIPISEKVTYKTVADNQTSVKVEIYEGEIDENCQEKNLLLGKFLVNKLPKKKAGEVKIEVQFKINENSLLEVTAWEKENKKNSNNIIINKPYELDNQKLKERGEKILFEENDKYNDDKFKLSIIQLEEEVYYKKNQKNIEPKIVKECEKEIIKKIGDFLKETDEISKLFISFFKYYLNKTCQFYQTFLKQLTKDDIKLLKEFKDDINLILEKIIFDNSDLIFEIIEEYVDIDDIYKSCVSYIMKNYLDRAKFIFFNATDVMKEKKVDEYDKVLNDLSGARGYANICLDLIDKFSQTEINDLNFTKTNIKEAETKIKVREEIIKVRKIKSSNQTISKDYMKSLKSLFKDYRKGNAYDNEDFKELGLIVGEDMKKFEENQQKAEIFEREFEKATIFLNWIQEKNTTIFLSDQEIYLAIRKIITDYPYGKGKEEEKMWDDFDDYKSKQISKDNYFLIIRGKYQNLMDNEEDDLKKEIYQQIIMFLNRI